MTGNGWSHPVLPYRSRRGWLLGVCRGLADHAGLPVGAVRIVTLLAIPLTGVWPLVMAYVVAGFVMKPEPVLPVNTADEAQFYQAYNTAPMVALRGLKERFDRLDRRVRRLESLVTSREYQWEQRLKETRSDSSGS